MNFSLENRIKCERRIVYKVITDALAAGYMVSVDDGEEVVLLNSVDKAAILAAMFSTDEDRLILTHSDPKIKDGWVRFIYGNDGPDVMSDYTVNLEDVLKGANALADRLGEEGL